MGGDEDSGIAQTAASDEPIGRIGWLQIDCAAPVTLARFWAGLLGTRVRAVLGDPPHYVVLEPAPGSAVRLAFQRVPEPKVGKNRLHIDLAVDDLERATRRAVKYGAAPVPDGDFEEHGIRWRVLADPEGNEFCLVPG